jgi:hypothetical protein
LIANTMLIWTFVISLILVVREALLIFIIFVIRILWDFILTFVIIFRFLFMFFENLIIFIYIVIFLLIKVTESLFFIFLR